MCLNPEFDLRCHRRSADSVAKFLAVQLGAQKLLVSHRQSNSCLCQWEQKKLDLVLDEIGVIPRLMERNPQES
jgi:hypothetical protein